MNKKNILLVSLGAAAIATILGIGVVITTSMVLGKLAVVSGLFSISSFLVGVAYPTNSIETAEFTDSNQTRKIVNN